MAISAIALYGIDILHLQSKMDVMLTRLAWAATCGIVNSLDAEGARYPDFWPTRFLLVNLNTRLCPFYTNAATRCQHPEYDYASLGCIE